MIIKEWSNIPVELSYSKFLVDTIKSEMAGLSSDKLYAIYESASEIISNIIHHACLREQDKIFSMSARWTGEEYFSITIMDAGISIPQSMLNKLAVPLKENLKRTERVDSALIDIAASIGQEINPGRGTGLRRIVSLVNKDVFDSVNIKSRHGRFLVQNSNKPVLSYTETIHIGTSVEIIISSRETTSQKKAHVGEISIAKDFSPYPAGRFATDGPHSAEAFMTEVLLPALERYEVLSIDLDGTYGYPSSFLEEAFGGIVRKGFKPSELQGRLNFISESDLHLAHRIWEYINKAT